MKGLAASRNGAALTEAFAAGEDGSIVVENRAERGPRAAGLLVERIALGNKRRARDECVAQLRKGDELWHL